MKKAGEHIGRNVVDLNNKDEDNSPKTVNDFNCLLVKIVFLTDLFWIILQYARLSCSSEELKISFATDRLYSTCQQKFFG